ncbi:hypothetical protein BC936DRAFT_136892 [Jimgerdemannia flammicorona]|nr:hypothetical protein BC936DRAFT_136892 [Jimgerdemannia flammicorona]
MFWVLSELTTLNVGGLEPVYLALLRQIRGGLFCYFVHAVIGGRVNGAGYRVSGKDYVDVVRLTNIFGGRAGKSERKGGVGCIKHGQRRVPTIVSSQSTKADDEIGWITLLRSCHTGGDVDRRNVALCEALATLLTKHR